MSPEVNLGKGIRTALKVGALAMRLYLVSPFDELALVNATTARPGEMSAIAQTPSYRVKSSDTNGQKVPAITGSKAGSSGNGNSYSRDGNAFSSRSTNRPETPRTIPMRM